MLFQHILLNFVTYLRYIIRKHRVLVSLLFNSQYLLFEQLYAHDFIIHGSRLPKR